MSTLMTDLPTAEVVPPSEPAQRLRQTMAAVRLSFTWFGVRKSLTPQQKAIAAESFGAEQTFLSAGKKLLDTKHPAFRGVTAVRSRVQALWKGLTLPYPEPGVRLLRQDRLDEFQQLLCDAREELTEAVSYLQSHFRELQTAARERLGRLYNSDDYPATLEGLFGLDWEFPAVEPPDYLKQLSPALYAQECQRVASRFDEAVRMAEQAFTDELAKLIAHLQERLAGDDDGQPKVFRDSAVTKLHEFFARFQSLNIRSNAELEALVAQGQQTVRGLTAQELRDSAGLRRHVADQLAPVRTALDELLVDRPRRRILRSSLSREAR